MFSSALLCREAARRMFFILLCFRRLLCRSNSPGDPCQLSHTSHHIASSRVGIQYCSSGGGGGGGGGKHSITADLKSHSITADLKKHSITENEQVDFAPSLRLFSIFISLSFHHVFSIAEQPRRNHKNNTTQPPRKLQSGATLWKKNMRTQSHQ